MRDKALHRMVIPLRSIAAGELGHWGDKNPKESNHAELSTDSKKSQMSRLLYR